MPITGKDLIKLGYTPGPWFGDALAEINASGLTTNANARDIADRFVAEIAAREDAIRNAQMPLRAKGAPLTVSISANGEDEQDNVDAVLASMHELMRTPTLVAGAVMPDACPAGPHGTITVGGVAIADNAIHPGMHSADICCSVQATLFRNAKPNEVMDAAHAATHFGPGERERGRQYRMPDDLVARFRANPFLDDDRLVSRAHGHLGTQGDGNHFFFAGRSEATGHVTIVTHHGSRAPGALLYKKGMEVAERFRQELSPETLKQNAWIPMDTQEGRDYWDALQIIRDWTKLNHDLIHDAVERALDLDREQRFWNEHNFVWREEIAPGHFRISHGKGATPIHAPFLPDTDGTQIVPLNMAEPVLFVQGERTSANLGFAPHGAGRNLSRSAHKRRLGDEPPEVTMARETEGLDVRFYCGNPDASELPSAYKNADQVKRDMEGFGLATVVDRIQPYGSIMAGDWEKDAPWRKKRKR